MKQIIYFALSCLMGLGGVAEENTARPVEYKVERIAAQLPEGSDQAAKFLWEIFSKDGPNGVSAPRMKEWRRLQTQAVTELVAKARSAGMEADALQAVLEKIDADRGSLAIVPVGAYRTVQGQRPVWIVVCKWEIEAKAPDSHLDAWLGHTRMFAYDLNTLARVAFKTCM